MFPYPINDLLHELSDAITKESRLRIVNLPNIYGALEKQMITKYMKHYNNKKILVSRRLGISRVKLDYKLKEYGYETHSIKDVT